MCNSDYNHELKLTQYADDTVLVSTDEKSLALTQSEISTFSQVAGPTLNKHTTELTNYIGVQYVILE